MEFMPSQRGKRLVIYQGNKYRKKRQLSDGSYSWECYKKGCMTKLRLNKEETQVLSAIGEHNHAVDRKIARQIVTHALKKASLEDMDTRPQELFDKVMGEQFAYLVDKLNPLDVKSIKKTINRTRLNAKKGSKSFVCIPSTTSPSNFDSSSDDSISDGPDCEDRDPLSNGPDSSAKSNLPEPEIPPKGVFEPSAIWISTSNVLNEKDHFRPLNDDKPDPLEGPQITSQTSSPSIPILKRIKIPLKPIVNKVTPPDDTSNTLKMDLMDTGKCDVSSISSFKNKNQPPSRQLASQKSVKLQLVKIVPQGSPSSTSPVPIAPKKAAPPPPPPPQPSQPPEVCLRWNSYHSNMQATFPSLLNNEQFVDVTLACEGRSIKCHKVMLSACSSYFEELLSQNPCQHPIVFMRDLKFWEVQALVEFMYSGEVNVAQEKLPSLLAAAEALQIKGLTPSTASSSNHEDDQSGGAGDTDESSSHPQPQKRVRKRKSAHPVAYPVRLQNTPPSPSPSGNQISQMPMQPLQKIKVPMMSPLPGTSHHREEPASYHPPVRIKRERSSTPPLALSLKEEPLDLGIDSSERNKDDSNGHAHNTTLQDAINRLHGKQQQHSIGQAPGLIKMESNGGLSEDDGSGSERSPPAQTDPGEGDV